jgi:SagB-type dehydrogenase family enzyme
LILAAVYANSFRAVKPVLGATGFRSYAVVQDDLRMASLESRVAEQFLVTSRLRRHDHEFEFSVGAFFTEPGVTMVAQAGLEPSPTDALALPTPIKLPLALDQAISRRRSVRSYTGEPLTMRYLATLMWSACGVTTRDHQGHGPQLRATPSGGALYPVELWVAALRIESLPKGIYRYLPTGHKIAPICGADRLGLLLGSLAVEDDIIMCSQAAALCLLVARPWRSMRKYGARGMRHVFLEAGAIAEQLSLAAVALGVGSVDCSSVYDDEAHEALGIDGIHETLIHSIVLGIPA